jgi:hypothetical protein
VSEYSGYSVPGAVWSAPSGVKVDPYDPAFHIQPDGQGDLSKPAIYLFSNSPDGDGIAYAMAEDGTVLGTHWCSHWGYMRHDLHDRGDRKAACEGHYPDGYRLVVLGACEVPPPEVIERNREQGRAAGVDQ